MKKNNDYVELIKVEDFEEDGFYLLNKLMKFIKPVYLYIDYEEQYLLLSSIEMSEEDASLKIEDLKDDLDDELEENEYEF